MNKGYRKFIKVVITILAVGLIYLAGYAVGHENVKFEKGIIPKIVSTNLGRPKDLDFSLFWDAWTAVKTKFNGTVDEKKMINGAISGAVQSLGDPYTIFMTKDEANRFSEDLQGQFDGIGAEIEARDGYLIIVAPLSGSPAEKAGIMAKDIITKIDGADVSEMTFYGAIEKIRGKKGTEVALTIARSGWDSPKDIKIKRDTIIVKSVKYEMKGNVGYIKVSQFGDDTLKLFQEAIDFIIKKNAKSVIIDLRNNPGGYLQDAVDMASLLLDKDTVVVIEKGKEGTETTYKTTLSAKIKDKPLIILVNGGSASASEIFSGAMKDHNRGKLVGEKTFGKGSVQTIEELKDGSNIKVTIAEWLTPNHTQINKKGIEPDVTIKLTEDDKNAGKDPQLDKAIEMLK